MAKLPNMPRPKVQQYVLEFLKKMLENRTIDNDIQRQKSTIYDLKNLYTNIYLKKSDATQLKDKLKAIEKIRNNNDSVNKYRNEFIKVIKEFRSDVINNDPDYSNFLIREKNIDYNKICWGAFV